MQKEQIKTILVNIVIAAVVLGVVVAGYFVFRGKTTAVPGTGAESTVTTAESTATIGAEIARIVAILKTLNTSVEDSTAIFRLAEFRSLEDFSVKVPTEPVGVREDPFVPTGWKLNYIKIINEVSGKGTAVSSGGQATVQTNAPVATTTTTTPTTTTTATTATKTQTQGTFFGDFIPNGSPAL